MLLWGLSPNQSVEPSSTARRAHPCTTVRDGANGSGSGNFLARRPPLQFQVMIFNLTRRLLSGLTISSSAASVASPLQRVVRRHYTHHRLAIRRHSMDMIAGSFA